MLGLLVSTAFGEEVKEEKVKKAEELPEVVVTATKTDTLIEDLPVTVHVLDAQKIENQPQYYVSNFGEVIRDLPGVHVGQYFPWGPPWVHLRGTGYFIGRTGYLIDGIPVTPFLSTVVNNNDIEKIEVLLGPSSALYGPNAMGGVVNIITKKGTPKKGLKIDLGYASRNTWRPHIEVGKKFGNFHLYGSFSGDYSDGYKMNPLDVVWELYRNRQTGWLSYASLKDNDYRNEHYALKLGWENKDIGLWLGYNFQKLFLDGGRPNRIWLDDGEQGVANLRFYSWLNDWLKFTLTFGYQHLDRPGPLNNRGAIILGGRLVGWDNTPTTMDIWKQKRYPFELQADIHLPKNNILTAGFLWLREEEKRETKHRITGILSSKSEYTTDNTAIYLQNLTYLLNERLTILAGIRYDHWKYHDIFDLISVPQRPSSVEKEKITYRGGLSYKISDYLILRASGGTGFWPGLPLWFFQNTRAGNVWREANPNLKPEKTWMVDLGFDLNLQKLGTRFNITFYYGKIKDIVSYRYDPHPTLPGVNIVRTENLGGAKIYGVEFGLEQKIIENLSLTGSLTLNHSEIINDPVREGNELRNSPDYWGSVGLLYKNPKIVNARINLRFSDDRFYDDENTELPYYHMKKYTVVDAKIWREFQIGKNSILSFSLSGENLTNKKYETEFIWIHPGRTIQLNVVYRYIF
jgi:iron complex outermembrane receptor protein